MDDDVVFEEEQRTVRADRRVVENHETPHMATSLIKAGVAKDERSARRVLVIICVFCLLLSAIFFSLTFIRRTDNFLEEPVRTTGTFNAPEGN